MSMVLVNTALPSHITSMRLLKLARSSALGATTTSSQSWFGYSATSTNALAA